MLQLKFLALILLAFVTNIQCVPLLQNSDATQSGSARNPEYNNGFAGGDMILPPESIARALAIRPATNNRWPGGVVPYEFAANITVNNTIFIVNQMRAMENLTQVNGTQCISFRPRNATDLYYITIFNGTGCYAPVGSWGNYIGIRPVSYLDSPTATCMISGTIQHELTHVLGFYHEQSRPDRDSYVSINWANIDPTQAFNFDEYNDTEVDTQMISYDYGSVMHYDRYAFAMNYSVPTITPTQNTSAFIGQRIQLSPIDILEIQRFYGCVPTPSSTPASTTMATVTNTSGTSPSSTSSGVTPSSTSSGVTPSSTSSSGISSSSANSSVTTTTGTGVHNTSPLHLGIYLICLLLIIYFSNGFH